MQTQRMQRMAYTRRVITVTAAATDNYQKKTVKITLNVSPKKAVLTSVKTVKGRKLTVKWKKDAKASGYQLQYSTDKKFQKNVKTVTIKSSKITSRTCKFQRDCRIAQKGKKSCENN